VNPETMQRLAAEHCSERLREAEHEQLAARCRRRRERGLAPRFGEALGHLLAAHRRPVPR